MLGWLDTHPRSKLRVGDWVEVRSKAEILRTLDRNGQLEGLPFMPEMFAFCGKRFRVYKRAHKACDTVFPIRSRRMAKAVHLETRCDGGGHGGCQAGCLIFWKVAWLKRVEAVRANDAASPGELARNDCVDAMTAGCSEEDVVAGSRVAGQGGAQDAAFICQATRLPYATTDLNWWEVKQYLEDYTAGNASIARMVRGFLYMGYNKLVNAGVGLGPILRWLYDKWQGLWGGVPYPRRHGAIQVGKRTPAAELGCQPGELVRVKSYEAILATLDQSNKNRGLYFDAEMVPYCGRTFRVLHRVTRIVEEKTGKLVEFKSPCIILEGVVCESRYSECRLFCPRSIYTYWREIWLERVGEKKVEG